MKCGKWYRGGERAHRSLKPWNTLVHTGRPRFIDGCGALGSECKLGRLAQILAYLVRRDTFSSKSCIPDMMESTTWQSLIGILGSSKELLVLVPVYFELREWKLH